MCSRAGGVFTLIQSDMKLVEQRKSTFVNRRTYGVLLTDIYRVLPFIFRKLYPSESHCGIKQYFVQVLEIELNTFVRKYYRHVLY